MTVGRQDVHRGPVMTLTLLVAAGIAIAAVAVFMATVRLGEATPALAGETTAVGLADPAAETVIGLPRVPAATAPRAEPEWHTATVTALHEAEDLLDALEAQGVAERELVVLGHSCFAVRWR